MSTTNNEKNNWLEQRKTGIGGSDVSAVLGLSPFRSPLDVYLEKTHQAEQQPENDAMYWGTKLEELVAKKYSEETGLEVRKVNSILRSKDFPMLIGNIDRAVCVEKGKLPVVKGEFRTNKILECKTARSQTQDWGNAGTDEVPEYYLTQCLHYLGLTGCQTCDLAVLFLESRKFQIYTIQADTDFITRLQNHLAFWWEKHVVKNVPPAPRSFEDVQKLFKKSVAITKTATDEIEYFASQFAELKRMRTNIDEKMNALKDSIATYLGDADTLVNVSGTPLITWKTGKDKTTTDWQSLAISLGATESQIQAHTKTTNGNRTFLCKIK